MITKHELTRRITHTSRALADLRRPAPQFAQLRPSGITAERVETAHRELVRIHDPAVIIRALHHLDEHAAGYPANSMPGPSGSGGVSDRTGEIVAAPFAVVDELGLDDEPARPDTVTSDADDLDTQSERMLRTALELLTSTNSAGTYRLGIRLERSTETVCWIIAEWARLPQARWCKHCLGTNGHRALAHHGRYRDLCRQCGDWRAVNKKLPPADVLPYLQRGQTRMIPARLLARHRARLPRSVRR